MKRLAIIGAGDLGQLIAHHAPDSGLEVIGFFDDTKKGESINEKPVLGGIDDIDKNFEAGIFDCLMIGIGYNHMQFRADLFERLAHLPFATIIHSSSYIDPSAEIGKGSFILPGCTLDYNVVIGMNVLLNTGCTIAHDSKIGQHSFLSPTVNLAGFISVGSKCNLGINTTIIDNIDICDNVRTGGGAVVVKNIEEAGLYVGVPAIKKS